MCVCTEHRESTLHFIFKLIVRLPVAQPAAWLLKASTHFLFFSAANKSATKSDYDQ